jgi:hypothetical protein
MAISSTYLIGNSAGQTTLASNTSGSAWYMEQERQYQRYRDEEMQRAKMEAMRMQAMQSYNPYTDTYGGMTAQQMMEAQKPIKAAQPEYLTNQKLLLLGEAS